MTVGAERSPARASGVRRFLSGRRREFPTIGLGQKSGSAPVEPSHVSDDPLTGVDSIAATAATQVSRFEIHPANSAAATTYPQWTRPTLAADVAGRTPTQLDGLRIAVMVSRHDRSAADN